MSNITSKCNYGLSVKDVYNSLYLMSIYDKSDKSSITDKELVELLRDLSMELQ